MFVPALAKASFPATRYQGSKRKLAAAIVEQLRDFDYATVLDAFGGTGAVAYAFKQAGKRVTYNDVLGFNHQIGTALIENDTAQLSEPDIESVGSRQTGVRYGDFIERTFAGIYFTDEENRWLDVAVGNISRLDDRFKRSLAWYALFQSAMAKRPYNLFHRGNLYMRTAEVPRSFGNKATWDRPFPEHFARFARRGNAAVIDCGGAGRAVCGDALRVEGNFDLVYIDPPYLNHAGVGVDYRHFYHFLEGMLDYEDWQNRVDYALKHRPLIRTTQPWSDPKQCHQAFRSLLERFRDSILVISYRSDGTPSIDELTGMLRDVKRRVQAHQGARRPYTLSTNRESREVLLVGSD